MKKQEFANYIRIVRSKHMPSSMYAEMMERLGVQDIRKAEEHHKTESLGWNRFQHIAALAVCLVLFVAVGWFAVKLHKDMQQMPVSPQETNTEPYEPVDISDIISRAMESSKHDTYSDIDNATSWFSKYVKEQQDGLRSIINGVKDPHNRQNYIIGPYIRSCCEQIGIVQCFQRFQPKETETLQVIHYQVTEDRRLYALIANLSDETQQLDCGNVRFSYYTAGEKTGAEQSEVLQFYLPEYPHGWLAPYLSGTVDSDIAEIPAHSVLELCALLPETAEIAPMPTPHITFYAPYDGVEPVIADGISVNWQEPDLPRTEENKLLQIMKDAYDESDTAKRISKQQYNIPSD